MQNLKMRSFSYKQSMDLGESFFKDYRRNGQDLSKVRHCVYVREREREKEMYHNKGVYLGSQVVEI